MRTGFLQDVKDAFADHRMMVRSGDPDRWEEEEARIDALTTEVIVMIKEHAKLEKIAKAAVEMRNMCPADPDATPAYQRATDAFEIALAQYNRKRPGVI